MRTADEQPIQLPTTPLTQPTANAPSPTYIPPNIHLAPSTTKSPPPTFPNNHISPFTTKAPPPHLSPSITKASPPAYIPPSTHMYFPPPPPSLQTTRPPPPTCNPNEAENPDSGSTPYLSSPSQWVFHTPPAKQDHPYT